MSIYNAMVAATDANDADKLNDLYENDDVMVMHQIMTFPNGSKEALMMVNMLKAGKISSTETGATPLPDA